MKDLFEVFSDLPDYPGKRAPKNRPKTKDTAIQDDPLAGIISKKYTIGGQEMLLVTITEMAKALRRRPNTVRMWERNGWIPKAPYRTPAPKGEQIPGKPSKGRRLYRLDQVEFLVSAMEKFQVTEFYEGDWNEFRKYIHENWPR